MMIMMFKEFQGESPCDGIVSVFLDVRRSEKEVS